MRTFQISDFELNEKQMAAVAEAYSKPEFEYPLFKHTPFGTVLKFTALDKFVVVMARADSECKVGDLSSSDHVQDSIPHTNYDSDLPYDRERDLWHGQPVMGWFDYHANVRTVGFYDAVNQCIFAATTKGINFHNYEAILPRNYTDWHLQNFACLDL